MKAGLTPGLKLGNHTFGHVGFSATSLPEYEDDFIRGDTVTRMLLKEKGQTPRYFRHPFLQLGPSKEIERAFENFISGKDYQIAPVTMDILVWIFMVAYANARTQRDSDLMKRVSDEYLKFGGLKLELCEQVTDDLFEHLIRQILLLRTSDWLAHWSFSKGKTFASPKPPEFIERYIRTIGKGSRLNSEE